MRIVTTTEYRVYESCLDQEWYDLYFFDYNKVESRLIQATLVHTVYQYLVFDLLVDGVTQFLDYLKYFTLVYKHLTLEIRLLLAEI